MDNLKYTEILLLNKKLSQINYNQKLSAKILSNVTINSFKEIFEYSLRQKQIDPSIEIGNFDNIVQDSIIPSNHNIIFVFYDVLNIVDNITTYFESLNESNIAELELKIKSEIDLILNNLKSTPIVVFNSFSSASIVSPFVNTTKLEKFVLNLNNHLYNLHYKNLVIVNIDKLIFELGRSESFDYRFYQSSKAPYSISFFKTYIRAIESTILKLSGKVKKAIIFDCDNTLWKGVVGEDGLDNIQMASNSSLGKAFYDVQSIAKYLSKNGVLIGLCSKNNLTDVDEVIFNHKDMILSNEDIIIKKINWNDKASNLKEIASELNIGIDSLLFVDDSDYEINLIREQLPEVATFQVPKNSYLYKNELLDFINQNINLSFVTEDLNKTDQYKEQIFREKEKSNFVSIEDYIASLEIKLNIHKNNQNEITRISQLTQKTNQFNLTTHRYSEIEIEKFMSTNNYFVFSSNVTDKFGNSGLTIVCIVIVDIATKFATIDTLLMSCRVIGRNIEYVFTEQIINFLESIGVKTINSSYIKSTKNSQVSDFYDKLGFSVLSEKENLKEYTLNLVNYKKSNLKYIEFNLNY